jgi:hypothetical protein
MDIVSLILLCLAQIFDGLTGRPHGRYADASGTTTIDYGWWKVLVRLPMRFATLTCKVRFDKITLSTSAGTLTFTYNSKDDTFEGPNSLRLGKVPAGKRQPS